MNTQATDSRLEYMITQAIDRLAVGCLFFLVLIVEDTGAAEMIKIK